MYKIYLFEQLEDISEAFIGAVICLLPEERQKKALCYRQLLDKKNCVIAYIMLKIALKECFQITDFSLKYGRYGKPFLVEDTNVFFSISHCKCGCVVAVADHPIGVDIQDIRPFSWDVARRVCCEEELKLLENGQDRDKIFTCMWAAKESYVKMTGEGITGDLSKINTITDSHSKIIDRQTSVISVCLLS